MQEPAVIEPLGAFNALSVDRIGKVADLPEGSLLEV